MLFIENPNTDPYQNHALEEWLMDHFEEDCFMLWRNDKAILLGKNQNVYSEINIPFTQEQDIKIVRRITGGGTVFTDTGNIMFTFISCDSKHDFANFRKFTAPILRALHALGIQAEFSGRNDLTIGGEKFSGNAQCRYGNKILHHGTLMYQADTTELGRALKVREIKLRDKGVSSIKSRVTNIAEYMKFPMDIEEFRSYLFNNVMKSIDGAGLYRLSSEEWDEVSAIAKQKYRQPAWIYGKSPQYNIYRETKFAGGIVEAYFDVSESRIRQAGIFGDFFSNGEISDVEQVLKDVSYDPAALRGALQKITIQEYFRNISLDELVSAFI